MRTTVKDIMTKARRRMAVVAGALLAAGSLGGVAATAATAAAPAAPVAAAPVPGDPDTLQQGDRSSPDTATGTAASGTTNGSENGTENGAEHEMAGEAENGPSDGPGGHADPSAAVAHEFNGVE
ncbi:hypothetical protein ACIQWA_06675 [Kitasatospora sp. NPDC098652]|uniref:hypothetical protein n=1 Tax=Kitasatospora sp. NPDC098652 TaxID=3364095 RepID=UPI00380394F1